MSRTWMSFIVLAIVIILAAIAYEFYVSISGGNVTFNKTVTPISNQLGTDQLATYSNYFDKIVVKDETLDNK